MRGPLASLAGSARGGAVRSLRFSGGGATSLLERAPSSKSSDRKRPASCLGWLRTAIFGHTLPMAVREELLRQTPFFFVQEERLRDALLANRALVETELVRTCTVLSNLCVPRAF